MTDTISKSDSLLNAWFATNTTKRGQITQTVYDTAYGPLAGLELDQQNLRNRVSYTQFIDTATNLIPSSATYYSYDIHGNVDTLVQDFGFGQAGGVLNMMNTSGNRFKKTVYDYDLISGKVNQVSYQRNQPDAYYHRYDYDAENRITSVYSARDTVMLFLFQSLQEQEAQYTYYNHGPVMNTVLGKMQVQKQDYVYTLQGWLKGINPVMGGTLANGKDTTDLSIYARDVYGFSLHYYNKDYRAIGTASASTTVLNAMGSGATQLYNGNIAAMAVTLSPFGGAGLGTRVYNYKYDQLNRLVAMDAHKGLYPAAGTLGTFTDTLLKDYQERISYDPNGNILTYNRHGDAARLSMDSMTYSYLDTTNKLDKVVDLANDVPGYSDIHKGQVNGNYKYDAIGNLVSDDSDHVSNVTWTVYGKIASLVKSGNTIRYVYDASGNRILKLTQTDTTAYVRDATGNVLSVYTKQAGADTVLRAEADIYGSSRLGMATQHMAPDTLITTLQKNVGLGTKVIFTRGEKLFELNNHLGNVLATVSDRKIEVDSSGDGFVDFYRADVISASDYYPFGMMMHSRNMHVGTDYRYGFNGKEKDTSISSQTAYDYGFRIYNAGIGRFMSVDPLEKRYASWTPYAYAMNDVIRCIDLEGAEKKVVVHWTDGVYGDGQPKISKTTVDIVQNYQFKQIYTTSGLPTGKRFAGTEIYYALPDGRFIQAETMYEEIGNGNPEPSAHYDYTKSEIPGKATDDLSYITEGAGGYLVNWWTIMKRDLKAPDNAKTLEDLGGVQAALAIIGAPIRLGKMTGTWVEESTHGWSSFSKEYQKEITGVESGQAFMLNGVKFDGISGQVLKEAKGRYAFLLEKGWAQDGLVKQAQSQIKAANGLKIEWHFAEKEAADAVKKLFEERGVKGIDVFYTPPTKTP